MNVKNQIFDKATKICAKYAKIETAIRNCNGNEELISIVQKKFDRAEKQPEKTVKTFCDDLVKNRLQKIVNAMPDEGYSMGSVIRLTCGKFEVRDDRTQEYAKSSKFRAVHGGYSHIISTSEFRNLQVVGGLVTYIYPNQRTRVKKCYWYSGAGKKHYWQLQKTEGFIYADYHSATKLGAKIGGERNIERKKEQASKVSDFKKALRLQYSYSDSLKAGNCEVGTRAFIVRCGLSESKKYRGKFLLNIAKEKSTSSVCAVEKMINYKVQYSQK